ncbi:hypothetical protein EVAR_5648_1 [Eumeta japonica]|uniref:Uncharacterized protein n=1 Tax=Eumeta variegata TaxID=151549 RepID=A0A4C1T761_EUMVA|nr:hypothetical protein EVAR_5648_1 [Eumeta japonica]
MDFRGTCMERAKGKKEKRAALEKDIAVWYFSLLSWPCADSSPKRCPRPSGLSGRDTERRREGLTEGDCEVMEGEGITGIFDYWMKRTAETVTSHVFYMRMWCCNGRTGPFACGSPMLPTAWVRNFHLYTAFPFYFTSD